MVSTAQLPRARRDFVFGPPGSDGRFVVKDPRRQAFFRLGARERFLLEVLDGKRDRASVRQEFAARFDDELAEEDLDDFLALARSRGLLEPEPMPAPRDVPSQATAQAVTAEAPTASAVSQARPVPVRQSILAWRKSLVDPDRVFTWLEPKLRFFWTRAFLVFSLLSIVAALSIAWSNRAELVSHFADLRWQTVVLGGLTLLFVTLLHECAHGLTCKHYGGEVHEIGFLLIFFMPSFFCNVSDAWLLGEKRQRLAVTFAGGYFELFLWSLAVLVWRLTMQDTLVNYLAWVIVSVSGVRVLFNFTPFIKLDGYYLLSDALEIANLRQRALEFVAAHLRWILWGAARPQGGPRPRVLLVYGVACWCVSLGLLATMLLAMGKAADRWVGHVGAVLLVVPLALFATRIMFSGLLGDEAKQMVLNRRNRTLLWCAAFVAVGAVLTLVRIEQRVSGTFQVQPLTHMQVRAPVAAFLKEVAGDEGQHVSAGERVAMLEVPELESRIAQKKAEIRETEANLELLKTGASQEELDDARQRVDRAVEWRDLAEADLNRSREAFDDNLNRLDQRKIQVSAQLKQALETARKAKELQRKRVITEEQLHEAQTNVKIAKAELSQVESEKAAAVSTGTLKAEEELARREKELAEAKAALTLLEAGNREEEIKAAEASLARHQEELAFLQGQQKKLSLFSRVDGVITTPHFQDRVGEYFEEGSLICEIEEAQNLEVEITLDECKVSKVEPGQTVELKARALPYETFEAEVERIAPSATSGDEQSTVTIYSRLADVSPELKPEMTGYARIYCGRRPIGEIAADYVMSFIRTEFWW